MHTQGCGRMFRMLGVGIAAAAVLQLLLVATSFAQILDIDEFDYPTCWIEGNPNWTWGIKRDITGCPAGDSVLAGRPARLRMLVSYDDNVCRAKVGVPPESVWVVPSTTSGLTVNFQPAKWVSGQPLRVIADDSTDANGKTRITMPSFSGCGVVTLQLYISGHLVATDTTIIRTVDTDGNQHAQSADLTSPCDLNYNGVADDATFIDVHELQGHWDRQVLFGRPMRRTSFCSSCDPDDPGALGESQATWSPDGKYVAGSMYVQTSDSWGTYSSCHIMYVPSDAKDGDTVTEFTTPGPEHDYNPCWSPLGYEIAFDRDDQIIYRKGVSGSDLSEHEIIEPEGNSTYPGNAVCPAFSPDGKWIAFSMADPAREVDPAHPTQDAWVIPVSGDASQLKRLTTGHQTFFPQWSPDGLWVYFDETQDQFSHKIMKVRPNIATGDPASDLGVAYEQSNSPSNTRQDWSLFGFSPDGQTLVAGRGTRDESDPDATPPPPRELRTLIEGCGDWQQGVINFPEFHHTSETVNSVSPKYSPDGTRVVFEAQPPGEARAQVWTTRRNMNLPPTITNLGGRAIVPATPYRDTTIEASQTLSQTVTASDPEGDALTYNRYSFTSALAGASGTLSWTPTLSDVGDHSVKFLVTTASGGAAYAISQITVVPAHITNLSVPLIGRTSVSLQWTEPSGGGGDIAWVKCSGGTIGDANWDDATNVHLIGEFTPQSAGTVCCYDIGGLQAGHVYYFAIRSRKNGVLSHVSNCPSAGTHTSGASTVLCDEGSLVLVGSGSYQSSQRVRQESAGNLRTSGSSEQAALDGSSILWSSGTNVTDLCKVQNESPEADGTYKVQIRDRGFHQASLDQLSLGVVDHDPETIAVAGSDRVFVGALEPVASVTDVWGKQTTVLQVDSTSTFDARSAQYLLVDLGAPATSAALVIESSGEAMGAYADSIGILVQKPTDGGWTTISTVHPRREFDQSVIDAQGNQTLRMVFLRSYQLKSLQRLTITSSAVPQPLTLMSATQTKVGSVSTAVSSSGGTATTVAPGDTLELTYSGAPVSAGLVRDVFLTAKGSYSGPAALESDVSVGLASGSIAAAPTYQFALGTAHPNPSSGNVAFSFSMAEEGRALIRVYDVAGRLVKTLVNGSAEAGPHDIVWDASDNGGRRVGAGVYFYRMDAGSWRSQRKVVFLER